MANIKKSKTKAIINPQGLVEGDKVIGSRGEIYTVGKVTKKKFERIDEDGDSRGFTEFSENQDGRRGSPNYMKIDSNESLEDQLCKIIKSDLTELKEEKVSDSTALTVANNDEIYNQKAMLERKRNEIEILNRFMEAKQNALSNLVSNLNEQVEQVKKIIGIIELYMGIHEEIVQIVEGPKADIETPISFRQLVLHMDEEVMCTKDDGVDFENLDKFDKWMFKNYKMLLPEEKCIVIARPRRYEKHYNDHALINSQMNRENFSTYIIIRNGANIYRLSTHQNIYPYLFPAEDEMEKLHKTVEEEGRYSDGEKAEAEILKYKRNVLMLQGIIDRTDIFKPIPPKLNLLKPETYDNHLNFIYDGTNVIGEGKLPYRKWLKELNKDLKTGDRFFFTGFGRNDGKDYRMVSIGWESWHGDDNGVPYDQRPDHQVYNIDRTESFETRGNSEKLRLVFKFLPTDTVYGDRYSSSKPRTRSNTYYVYHDDDCIINYERVTVEDIDYYINDRINKQHYLKMLPILKGIKKQLLAEQKMEDAFTKLLISQLDFKPSSDQITEVITWWKNKVKIKRPLIREDAKALRMITGRLKKLSRNKK
jgi:hypothetical protein